VDSEAAKLIARYYDALNLCDLATLDALMAPDLVYHGPFGALSRIDLRRILIEYRDSFPDLVHSVRSLAANGDRVTVGTVTEGTSRGPFLGHAPSGRQFSAEAQTVYRVENGRIQEIWEDFDTLGMLRQLGLTPKGATQPGRVTGRARRHVPGPRAAVSLAQIRSNPLTFLAGLTREYGDHVRYVCDGRESILLNEPGAIRHVLHDNAPNYTKLNTPDLELLRPMLGDGLLTAVGPVWKQDRQLLHPAFTRRRLESAATVMVAVTEDMLARWCGRPEPEAYVDMTRELSRLTLEIAAQVLYSTDVTTGSEAFSEAMDVLNESMSHAGPYGEVQRQFRPALELIRRTVLQIILARRFAGTGEDDVLASLLSAQRERGDSHRHLVDQAVTLLLAGHETTAKALSWAIALLAVHDDVRAQLLEELDGMLGGRRIGPDDLLRLPFTRAVVEEALRLYPPIWLLTRTAVEDDEVAGYAVPAGTLVAISPYLVHRHPDLWDRPDSFDPKRFLAGDSKSHAFRYLPFGHGPRHCIGKYFAMLEMPLVLATVYAQVVPMLRPGHSLEPEALVTLRPRDGLPMRPVRQRRRSMTAAPGRPEGGPPS
jgi:steroid delta-isomerase-like uncharacterized protein